MPHSELSGQKKIVLLQKPCVFLRITLSNGRYGNEVEYDMFSDLDLIMPITVEYSDDFQGLPHSENLDLPHSAEPKIKVCPIAKILKTGIGWIGEKKTRIFLEIH